MSHYYLSKRTLTLGLCSLVQLATGSEEVAVPDLPNKPPSDFAGFSKWMDNASPEDKRAHLESLSENVIAEHGEETNEIRLCVNLDQNWMGLDHWVD